MKDPIPVVQPKGKTYEIFAPETEEQCENLSRKFDLDDVQHKAEERFAARRLEKGDDNMFAIEIVPVGGTLAGPEVFAAVALLTSPDGHWISNLFEVAICPTATSKCEFVADASKRTPQEFR
jgi:hypothetical protein